jgi:hypothetical protein
MCWLLVIGYVEGDVIQGHGEHARMFSVKLSEMSQVSVAVIAGRLVLSDAEGDIVGEDAGVDVPRLYLVSCGCVSSRGRRKRNWLP